MILQLLFVYFSFFNRQYISFSNESRTFICNSTIPDQFFSISTVTACLTPPKKCDSNTSLNQHCCEIGKKLFTSQSQRLQLTLHHKFACAMIIKPTNYSYIYPWLKQYKRRIFAFTTDKSFFPINSNTLKFACFDDYEEKSVAKK